MGQVETASEWKTVVDTIVERRGSGNELYERLAPGLKFLIRRAGLYGNEGDLVNDTLCCVVEAIKKGQIREPGALPSYARTVLRRLLSTHIKEHIRVRTTEAVLEEGGFDVADERVPSPEQTAIERQKVEIARKILARLKPREKEILYRFYIRNETPEQIQLDLNLSATQFRLIKSRAKANFIKLSAPLRRKPDRVLPFFQPLAS